MNVVFEAMAVGFVFVMLAEGWHGCRSCPRELRYKLRRRNT